MEKVVKTTDGHTLFLFQTKRLGHDIMDKKDPKANESIWVLHNTEGPALVSPTNRKEYYFFGIYQGSNSDVLKEFKRHHNGLPPAKNPLFKTRL